MKRLPGWRARLSAALIHCDAMAFSWETGADCFLGLIAPAVEAQTGVDIAQPYRGRYRDTDSAKTVLAAAGFASLGDALAAHFMEIAPAHAGIGDIAIVPVESTGLGEAGGIVIGRYVSLLGAKGRASVPLRRATRAFRVGDDAAS